MHVHKTCCSCAGWHETPIASLVLQLCSISEVPQGCIQHQQLAPVTVEAELL